MISVAVIEDHPLFRQGIVQSLRAAPEIDVVAAAGSIEEFEDHSEARPDVILLDLHLPGLDGVSGVERLVERQFTVLVVSATSTRQVVLDAMAAGASGYVTKEAESDELHRAVTHVSGGGTYVSSTLASFLLTASAHEDPYRLTSWEKEILNLLAQGERDQDIAEQLHLSTATVRSHLDRIRDKTGHRRRSELTRLAIQEGLVEP